MNEQDINNIIKGLEPYINQKMKENSIVVKNSTEKENSNLVYSLKEVFQNELKEQKEHIIEIKSDVKEVKSKLEFQNGRVRKLEDWQNSTQGDLKGLKDMGDNYRLDKGKIWTGIGLLMFFGGVIITLSIMAIDTKIEKAVEQALAKYDIEYQSYEER